MADFQNVGNFDAGVFTPKLGGVAPSGSSFTMDAAGIASGGAFLTSELEKRDPLIRKGDRSVCRTAEQTACALRRIRASCAGCNPSTGTGPCIRRAARR